MFHPGQTTRTVSALATFLFLMTGCFSPLQVRWNGQDPVIGPQIPEPQGFLTIYSERYTLQDEGVPVPYRCPVRLYTRTGQFLGEYRPIDDSPIHLTVSPGEYLVMSESNWALRKVQVRVQDGRTTVVPESLIAQAVPVSAS